MSPARGGTTGPAVALAVAWAAALAWLGALWVDSPFSGILRTLAFWSVPAVPLALVSARWLPKAHPPLRLSPAARVLVVLAWAGAFALAWSRLGAEMRLDGMILRQPAREWAGVALRWTPLVVALAISVAGLAGALEARYRLARRE